MKNISKLVVVKTGTNSLFGSNGLRRKTLENLARQIVSLFREGVPIAVTTSGAVALGREAYRKVYSLDLLPSEKREAAGIGAMYLLQAWSNAFKPYGMVVAQIWVTYEPNGVISNARDIKRGIMFYLARRVVPLINYNDIVSGRELELGDNDHLARVIAELIGADTLLFLTEKGGVCSLNPDGSLGKRYCEVDLRNLPSCSSETSSGGNGGMKSKLREAVRAYANGKRRVFIAGADEERILHRISHGERVKTMVGTSNLIEE